MLGWILLFLGSGFAAGFTACAMIAKAIISKELSKR